MRLFPPCEHFGWLLGAALGCAYACAAHVERASPPRPAAGPAQVARPPEQTARLEPLPDPVPVMPAAQESSPFQEPPLEPSLQQRYDRGMTAVAEGRFEPALLEFGVIISRLECGGGSSMFVQRPDGFWEYRKDEIGELYALASLRSALVASEHLPCRSDEACIVDRLCEAFRARPDLVLTALQTLKLSPNTRRAVRIAKRKCYVRNGWHSDTTTRPHLGAPNNDPTLPMDL